MIFKKYPKLEWSEISLQQKWKIPAKNEREQTAKKFARMQIFQGLKKCRSPVWFIVAWMGNGTNGRETLPRLSSLARWYIYFCKLEALHWHNPVIPVVGATILSFMKVRPFSDYLPYSSGSVPMCLLHCPSPDFGTGEDCMKAPQCVQCKCKFMQTALRCPNSNFLNWNLVWILAPQHHFMYGPTPPKSVPLPRFE